MPFVPPRLARMAPLLFLATSACWVVLSNQITFALPLQPEQQHLVQTSKGLLFALAAAALLHWQLKRWASAAEAAEDTAAAGGAAQRAAVPFAPRLAATGRARSGPPFEQSPFTVPLREPRSGAAAGTAAQASLPPIVAAAVSRRVAVEAGLLLANLDAEFSLHLQPKWCVRTRRTIGAEALLRWNCPGIGPVSPEEFIPIAEQHPVIRDIGRWVLVQVVQALASDRDRHRALQVSINLSASQLEDESFPRFAAALVTEAGLSASCIQFELTETSMVCNQDAARIFLEALRNDGFSVALDDFGVGYSCLSRLATFPVDAIKLDRSFVEHLPHDAATRVVASGIIAMAAQLDIAIVAEGVETEVQRQFLESAGCHAAQGWLVCKALPMADFFGRQARQAVCAVA